MSNQYLAYATSAMQTLNAKWFTPNTPTQWGGGSNFWRTPTICLEIIDYMAVSGSADYITTIENARLAGEPYIGNCGYYDDATCWGRFFITAYAFFNNNPKLQQYAAPYLQDAIGVHQDLVKGWDNVCGGGIWWKRDPKSYPGNTKASNATLGSMEIALGLYEATNDSTYLKWAQQAWAWIQQKGLISGGLVSGGVTAQCLPDPANGPVIALQGNPLGPLWSLYQATQDTTCLDVCESIVQEAILQMIWPTASAWTPQTAIILSRSDVEWNAQSQTYHSKWSGETPFKGIFVGFLGEFAKNLATVQTRSQAAHQFAEVLAGNANTVWANFPDGAFGADWHTSQPNYQPGSDDSINASLQYSGLALFLAAAKTVLLGHRIAR